MIYIIKINEYISEVNNTYFLPKRQGFYVIDYWIIIIKNEYLINFYYKLKSLRKIVSQTIDNHTK